MTLNLVHTVAFLIAWWPRSLQKRAELPYGWLCPCSAYEEVSD
jgi:hypothetical protein